MAALLVFAACGDRRSDIAVVYRGNVSVYRPLVHVRLDSGSRAREVVPAFPSAAHPLPVPTHGELPFTVVVVATGGDTLARYSAPPVRLAERTAYQLGIVIGSQRPAANRCTGVWGAAAVASGGARGRTIGATSAAESLFVSVSASDRRAEPPRCDD